MRQRRRRQRLRVSDGKALPDKAPPARSFLQRPPFSSPVVPSHPCQLGFQAGYLHQDARLRALRCRQLGGRLLRLRAAAVVLGARRRRLRLGRLPWVDESQGRRGVLVTPCRPEWQAFPCLRRTHSLRPRPAGICPYLTTPAPTCLQPPHLHRRLERRRLALGGLQLRGGFLQLALRSSQARFGSGGGSLCSEEGGGTGRPWEEKQERLPAGLGGSMASLGSGSSSLGKVDGDSSAVDGRHPAQSTADPSSKTEQQNGWQHTVPCVPTMAPRPPAPHLCSLAVGAGLQLGLHVSQGLAVDRQGGLGLWEHGCREGGGVMQGRRGGRTCKRMQAHARLRSALVTTTTKLQCAAVSCFCNNASTRMLPACQAAATCTPTSQHLCTPGTHLFQLGLDARGVSSAAGAAGLRRR